MIMVLTCVIVALFFDRLLQVMGHTQNIYFNDQQLYTSFFTTSRLTFHIGQPQPFPGLDPQPFPLITVVLPRLRHHRCPLSAHSGALRLSALPLGEAQHTEVLPSAGHSVHPYTTHDTWHRTADHTRCGWVRVNGALFIFQSQAGRVWATHEFQTTMGTGTPRCL